MSTTHIASLLWVMDACFFSLRSKKLDADTELTSFTHKSKVKMHDSKIHCESPDSESLTCYQTYRCTTSEGAWLKNQAAALRVSMSALSRSRVMLKRDPPPPPPEINLALYQENGQLKSNLNQLVRHMNEQRLAGHEVVIQHAQLKALVEKLVVQNDQLRADLIGVGNTK